MNNIWLIMYNFNIHIIKKLIVILYKKNKLVLWKRQAFSSIPLIISKTWLSQVRKPAASNILN